MTYLPWWYGFAPHRPVGQSAEWDWRNPPDAWPEPRPTREDPPMPSQQFHIGDYGKDLDDEVAAIITAGLIAGGAVDLTGAVANLAPAAARARLAKGTYTALGLDVPVAVGTAAGADPAAAAAGYEFADAPYVADSDDVDARDGGLSLLRDAGPVDLVLMSGMLDAYWLLTAGGVHPRSVTLMSGVEPDLDDHGRLVPNHTANNDFDYRAALNLYRHLQDAGIPMRIVTREAAFAAAVPREFYDTLAATGHPVGRRLQAAQQAAIESLWQQTNLSRDDPARTLPWGPEDNPRTPAWFRAVFCDGDGEGVPGTGSIWPYVRRFAQYDALTVMAAVPALRASHFRPERVDVGGVTHEVIGVSAREHGVVSPARTAAWLEATAELALTRATISAT